MVLPSGLDEGDPVNFYSADGRLVDRSKAINGEVSVAAKADEVVIAKFGTFDIKIAAK